MVSNTLLFSKYMVNCNAGEYVNTCHLYSITAKEMNEKDFFTSLEILQRNVFQCSVTSFNVV